MGRVHGTSRTSSLTSHPQSPLDSPKSLMPMVSSSSWMPTSPEETSRTLSPTSHPQSPSVLPKSPMLMAFSSLWMPMLPEETLRTSSPISHLQSLSVLHKPPITPSLKVYQFMLTQSSPETPWEMLSLI